MARYHTALLFMLVITSDMALADNWQSSALHINDNQTVKPTDNATFTAGLTVNQDDITSDQDMSSIQLSPAQQHEALVWGLTPEQEQRYVFLMQNKSELQYQGQHLSPVWILGLHARTDEERDYFAKVGAQQERQYVAQNIAWNNAYTQAYRQLTQDLPVIKPFDMSKYSPMAHQNVVWQQSDIVNLFVKSTDTVGEVMTNVMSALSTYSDMTLNVFFIGNPTPSSMQTWANHYSLPTTWVMTKRITLNNGDAEYANLNAVNKKTPLLILVRDKQAHLIDTGVL